VAVGQTIRARTVVLAVAASLLAFVAIRRFGPDVLPGGALRRDLTVSDLRVPARPPPLGAYAFENKRADGSPVGWDPCRTIHYVVRVGPGPLNGVVLVKEGVDRLSRATGLHFVFDGVTDEVRQAESPGRPGDPVWIGWATEQESTLFKGQSERIGSTSVGRTTDALGRIHYTYGAVGLLPYLDILPGYGAGRTAGNVILHELGHLVGLDHIGDPNEIMHPGVDVRQGDGYGAGDLEGLWRLGASQGCD
jgi:hypothetical protein